MRIHKTSILVILILKLSFSAQAQLVSKTITPDSIKYFKVNSILAGNTGVSIADQGGSPLSAGDIVLVIQMKGGDYFGAPPPVYANQQTNNSGRYEFIMVRNFYGSPTNEIHFSTELSGTYDNNGSIQVVYVPYADYINVNGPFDVEPWDSAYGKGGVLALIANRKININANIIASGKGFKGAMPDQNAACSSETNDFYLTSVTGKAALKGEGVVKSNFTYNRGKGYAFNAGGGGNGRFSGGGGGSNWSDFISLIGGGDGGAQQKPGCSVTGNGQGANWNSKSNIYDNSRVIMGGGGGTSTQDVGFTASAGGNGGGIIFLITDTINFNNNRIIEANGASVPGVATAGGGGGGAGGSILLDVNQVTASGAYTLAFNAAGGAGGDATASSLGMTCTSANGAGGGGGGGVIWYSHSSSYMSGFPISTSVAGGEEGLTPGHENACVDYIGSPGDSGTILYNLNLPLTGFLFNFVYNVDDSICEGTAPDTLKASIPKGKIDFFRYYWQKKVNAGSWTTVSTTDSTSYYPGIINDVGDVYYRRIVKTGAGVNEQADTSLEIYFKVWDKIANNTIYADTTICYSDVPHPIHGNTLSGGNGSYTYNWYQSTGGTWTSASGTQALNQLNPPALTLTTRYRRFITSASGVCVSTSDTVLITVQPLIQGNTIGNAQTICENTSPIALTGTQTVTGGAGAGTYSYLWLASTNQVTWPAAGGTNNLPSYSPGTLIANRYYVRYVTSGKCEDSSNVVMITVQPALAGFGITGTDSVCYNTIPIQQTASGTPTGGNGSIYTYNWIRSTNNTTWQNTGSSGVSLITYQPPALLDTTWYRYVLTSGSCIDTSSSTRVLVMPQIVNNLTSYDSIICENLSPAVFNDLAATGGWGSFTYKWQTSLNDVSYSDAPGTNNQRQYTSGTLSQTTYFRRIAFSPLTSTENCQAIGNRDIRITVLPELSNFEIAGWPVLQNCYNTPLTINGNSPTGGQSGAYIYTWEENPDTNNAGGWTPAGGSTLNNGEDFRTIQLTDSLYFRRFVTSGLHNTCQATSQPVKVHINTLPSGELLSFEDTICSAEQVLLTVTNIIGNSPFTLYISNNVDSNDINNSAVNLATYPTSLDLPSQLFQYVIDSLVDINNCKAVDKPGEVNILVYQVPESAIPDTSKACGTSIQLSATPSVGEGTWNCNYLTFTNVNDPQTEATLTADLNNVYTTGIVWTEINGICSDSDEGTLAFYKQPEIVVIVDSLVSNKIFDEAEVSLEALTPDAGQGTWSTPNAAPDIEDIHNTSTNVSGLGEFGEYLFFWTVENGVCQILTDSISIFSYDITAPTGFSPNNDDINDLFVIRGLDPEKGLDYGIIIFDRWGQTVYKSEKYTNDWDGKSESGKDLPEDTYFFVLNLSDGRDYKGFVVVKR